MIDSEQLKQNVVKAVEEIRATNPMAGSITNTVTIDFVANAQLAVGGSAAMVYLPDEGEALVAGGGAISNAEVEGVSLETLVQMACA